MCVGMVCVCVCVFVCVSVTSGHLCWYDGSQHKENAKIH
jgi:hypothetical protein